MKERRKKLWKMLLEERDNRQLEAQYELAKRLTIEYPDYDPAWAMLGECLASMYRYEESRAALEQAYRLMLPKPHQFVYRTFGLLYENKGNYRVAERWLRKAVKADPTHSNTRLDLGDILLRQGKFGEAKRQFRGVIRSVSNPGNGDKAYPVDYAYMQLGVVLRAERKYREAIDCFNCALRLHPKYKEARHARRDTAKALRMKNKPKVKSPPPISLSLAKEKTKNRAWRRKVDNQYVRLRSEWGDGNVSTAFELAREMTRLYPFHATAWITLGEVFTKMARYDEARTAIKRSIRTTSDNLIYLHQELMGSLYEKKGDYLAAE